MSTIHNTLIGSELHYSKIKTGSGSPNLNSLALAANAWVGDIYLDIDTNNLYVRKGLTGVNDWVAAPIQHIGNHPMIFTTTGATSITLPTSGTLLSNIAGSIPYSLLSLTGSIVNSDLAGSIAVSKLVAMSPDRVALTDASGFLTVSPVTATQVGYLSTTTSNIQAQLDAKQNAGSFLTGITGDVYAPGPGNAVATIQPGVVTNAMLAGSIVYSKLSLNNSITSADLAGSVAYAKLALSNSIVNADINVSAAIADSKLATIATPGKVDNAATTAASGSGANTIVLRDVTGSFSANNVTVGGTLTASGNLAVGSITTTGAANLGNASSAAHTLQGTQYSLPQVNIINNANGADAAGLKISLPNDTTSSVLIQEWMSGVVAKGSVDGAGKWKIGGVGGTQVHVINGTASATVAFTAPVINITNYEEFTAFGTPATPALNKVRVYTKGDKKLYTLDDTGLETEVGSGSGITSLSGDVTATGPGPTVATIGALKVTNGMLAGSIAYSKLSLSGGVVDSDISASAAIADTKLATIATPLKVSNSATTATTANTANAIVARDGSGNIAVSGVSAASVDITGTAGAGYIHLTSQSPGAPTPAGGLNVSATTTAFKLTNTSGFTASTDTASMTASRAYTLPDLAGTFVLTTGAQTLSNKTLSAPVINSPTGIVKGDVGLGNADNTSDVTKNSATVTLTNKTISGASNTLTNIANSSTTATSANTASAIVARDVSGNFSASVGTFTQVVGSTEVVTPISRVTNYTDLAVVTAPASATAGTLRVYAKSDKKLYTKDDVGTETQVGAGGITALTGHVTASGSGSVMATIPASTISDAMLAGSISEGKLLGSIPDSKLLTISTPLKVSNSATTATSANTASAIVARDASGDFSASAITARRVAVSGATNAGDGYITLAAQSAGFTGLASSMKLGAFTNQLAVVRPDGVNAQISLTAISANRVYTLPDVSGTLISNGDSGTVTDAMLYGSISDSKLLTISTALKVSNSATTANSSNVASAIVARDASGDFAGSTISATTAVSTPRVDLTSYADFVYTTTPASPATRIRVYAKSDGKMYTLTPAGVETALLRVGDAGTGDVVGPASAGADNVATYNGTTGKIIKNGPAYTEQPNVSTIMSRDTNGYAAARTLEARLVAITGNTNAGDGYATFFKQSAAPAGNGSYLHLYAKTDDKLYTKTSAGIETVIGNGINEQPVKNYLRTYSAAEVAPGTLSTLATTTTAITTTLTTFYADSTSGAAALSSSASTALRGSTNYLSAVSGAALAGTSFFQLPAFALEGSDLGKPVSISLDINSTLADGDWDVVVMRYNSSGTYQSFISVAGNASSASVTPSAKLPSGTTQFNGFFVPDSTTAGDLYALRFRRLVGSTQIRIDSLFVGNQPVRTGAIATDDVSHIPSSVPTNGTLLYGFNARVANRAIIRVAYSFSAAGTTTFTEAQILPPGLTVDTSKMLGGGARNVVGHAQMTDAGVTDGVQGEVSWSSTAGFLVDGLSPSPSTADAVRMWLEVPITGWSSNVTMADRAVEEYAFNTNVTDANDAVSFGYGVGGQFFGSFSTLNRRKTVRFTTPIQQTDKISIEIYDGVQWLEVCSTFGISLSATTGIMYQPVTGSATDIEVIFGSAGYAATARGGSNNWASIAGNASFKWRVRKVSGGASVGFPVSTANVVGRVDGLASSGGYIGEVKTAYSTATNITTTDQYFDSASIVLTAGTWLVSGTNFFLRNGATFSAATYAVTGICGASGTASTGLTTSVNITSTYPFTSSLTFSEFTSTITPFIVYCNGTTITSPTAGIVSPSTTLYLKGYLGTFTSGNPTKTSSMQAIRIA